VHVTRLVMKDSIEEKLLHVRLTNADFGEVENFKDSSRALDPGKTHQKYLDFLEYLS
jgi:hypothetical protein